jgi:hypothetical protein
VIEVVLLLVLALWLLLVTVQVSRMRRALFAMARAAEAMHEVVVPLANDKLRALLQRPLIYCPRHGGQEQQDGVCVECRRVA